MAPELRAKIEAWAKAQDEPTSLSEAVRRLVEASLARPLGSR